MIINILDTSICDNNLGNQIIMESVNNDLRDIFPTAFFIKLPYIDTLGNEAIKYMKQGDYLFLGGTNALSSEMENYKQIGIDHTNYKHIEHIILMGVGWWQYQGNVSSYTEKILKHCLHANIYHSVRDTYTKNKLHTLGIDNVLVTGCPTLWGLSTEHCKQIKKGKSDNLLLSFTNYSKDKRDLDLFKLLKNNYKDIYLWVQGPEDLEYARNIGREIHIIPPRLDALDELLSSNIDLDYIGTRLHAGIRAMQFKRRSIIIGIDNRAIEMGKDINFPIVLRDDLNSLQNKIYDEFETRLRIPFDEIDKWKMQFQETNSALFNKKRFCTQNSTYFSIKPVSNVFGFDRGLPIDRYYIEKFLETNKFCIRGRVLEIGDNSYTQKYGSGVIESEVLNVTPSQNATIIGDLSTGKNIPESAFDCIILTQTIQTIYDVKSALKNAMKALKPQGTLLITTAGISQISRYDMDRWGDYWRFTDKSLAMLLAEIATEDAIHIDTYGNVAVAKAFLDGYALHELAPEVLEYKDKDYQVLLSARVQKRENPLTQKTHTPPTSLTAPLILLYHRVAEDPIDAQLLAVSPENFEAHLKELAGNYRVIPLHQLLEEVRRGKLNANTIALTFDDGYLDNLTNAVPLLEKYGLHSTIFVTAGMVGSDQEFWWDAMERVFLTGNDLPELLSITTSDGIKEWNLTTAEGRLHALDNIGGFLRSKPYERLNPFISNLLEQVGVEQEGRLTHRTVNAEQLKKLANSPSIEIGSHSVTHTKLSILSPERQRQEIRESRNQLESIIQKPVRIFSYPFGTVDDFTTDTANMVKEEGYEAGIANTQGSVVEPINMYSIPRRLVRNWPELLFARWLKEKDKAKLEAETIFTRTKKLVDYQLRIST